MASEEQSTGGPSSEGQGTETPSRESGISRAIGAIVSPRQTFESIARRPTWLFPVLLVIILNVVLLFSFSHRVGWRATIEKQMATSSRMAQLTPQQQQQAMARAERIAPIGAAAGATIGFVIILLAMSLIFLGAFNIIFGAGIRFKQSVSITAYAFMPGALRGLLGLLIVWVRPPEGVTLQNLVMSNVGAFLPTGVPAWLQALGSSLDIFTFWSMALLAVGFAAAGAARKVRFGSALAVIVSIWLVYLLGLVGVTAMFG
jgi:hypothetical protein